METYFKKIFKKHKPNTKMSSAINKWPERERPREKLIFHGEKALTDAELLALLINTGNSAEKKTAVDLGRDLLKKYKTFKEIAKTSVNELLQIKGIGPAKASKIKACFEINKRIEKQKILKRKKIFCAKEVFKYFKTELNNEQKESVGMIFINQKNEIVSEKISKHKFNEAQIDIRKILENAIKTDAVGIILCHNHPSGKVKPTKEDINTTFELKKILQKIGITLLDHVIIGKEKYYSFVEAQTL